MDAVKYLRDREYVVRERCSLHGVHIYTAKKKIDDITIRIYIEVKKGQMPYIMTVDMLKEYHGDFRYNKLLKTKLETIYDLDDTINKLIEIINK